MVGVAGFEPAASQFQTEPSTRLTLYPGNVLRVLQMEAAKGLAPFSILGYEPGVALCEAALNLLLLNYHCSGHWTRTSNAEL